MNRPNLERFVNAIASDLEEGGFREVTGTTLRRNLSTAVQAAMPMLNGGFNGLASQRLPQVPPHDGWLVLHGTDGSAQVGGYNEVTLRSYAVDSLSAQPSPGGQDALLASLVARWRKDAEEIGASNNTLCQKIANCTMRHAAELQAALAARQPVSAEDWSRSMAEKEAGQYVGAGAHGICDEPAARQPVGEPLWCMHILGPDDVHAAPSKAHAEKAAAALNAFHAAREEQSEHDPKVEAVVAPWPHSAESHAESVADFIPGWLLPRWQVEAIQTDATPTAQAVVLERYDAGLLSDVGGGDTAWWLDYLRSELARAHDHYQHQVNPAKEAGHG